MEAGAPLSGSAPVSVQSGSASEAWNASGNTHARGAVVAAILIWALGVVLREALEQVGFVFTSLLAVWLLIRRPMLLRGDLRHLAFASLAVVGWQLVSPALALLTGAEQSWPSARRYGQAPEPLGAVAVAVVGAVGLPWGALGWILGVGWVTSAAVAVYQHLVPWPLDLPRWTGVTVDRVRENFAVEGPARYGAGGFHFHRLRFAHTAIAVLGPALAAASGAIPFRRRPAIPQGGPGAPVPIRACGAIVAASLILGVYVAFARAALGTSLLVMGACLLFALRGWPRRAGMAAVALLAVVVLASPGWRERLATAGGNLFSGERTLAMRTGLRIFAQHPLLGVGFGNHQPAALALARDEGITEHLAWDSHNLWITALAETGLVGFVLLLGWHALMARALWRRAGQSWIALGALASFVGFHALGLVHYLPFHSSVALAFYFIWGLGLASASAAGAESSDQRPRSAHSA
jgi:O-antigen ligase